MYAGNAEKELWGWKERNSQTDKKFRKMGVSQSEGHQRLREFISPTKNEIFVRCHGFWRDVTWGTTYEEKNPQP